MGDKIEDEVNKYGSPHTFDPDFRGPVKSRSCTDILCLLLFVVFLVGWGVVAVIGVMHGDPTRLLYPTDSRGQVCGRDTAVKDKPYLFFFDLTRCASPKVVATGCATPQVCVKECPSKNWFYNGNDDAEARRNLICQYDIDPLTTTESIMDLVSHSKCAFYYVRSGEVAKRCIPSVADVGTAIHDTSGDALKTAEGNEVTAELLAKAIGYLAHFYKTKEVAEGAFEDIKATWHLILGFCVLAMAVSLVWIFLLRFISKVLIWFSMVAFVVICGFACYYSMDKYLHLRSRAVNSTNSGAASSSSGSSESSFIQREFSDQFSKYSELESTWLFLFFVFLTLLIVCILLLIILRKRINIAVALIGQASKAVGDMMSTLLMPVLPYLLQVVTISVFCVIAVYLASAGRPQYTVACAASGCCAGVQEGTECDPGQFNSSNSCATAKCQFKEYYVDPHIPRLQVCLSSLCTARPLHPQAAGMFVISVHCTTLTSPGCRYVCRLCALHDPYIPRLQVCLSSLCTARPPHPQAAGVFVSVHCTTPTSPGCRCVCPFCALHDLWLCKIYNVFALFWCMFFISALGEMVLAGAFSSWYWAFDKSKDLPMLPVTNSLGRTLRYHIGTLAFGSLIIAIVRMIRLIFEYIDKKVREKTDNIVVKCLMCCCRCCLYCLEKFLKFVNRNAYVYCAIYGKNFCSSARSSFSLLMRNIARVVVLDKVTDFLLFIGKMVVTGSIGIFAFFVFSGEIPGVRDELPHTNYYLTPVILITIVTYFISSAFFSVYEMGVDTLFLCFLEDSERNDGSPEKPYFMSKDLMKILHKENKFKED
ncbi:Choline transporter-like [Trinorchestia longiramus]|nr:Choline transporter-like [Trinorchestia longiramus]